MNVATPLVAPVEAEEPFTAAVAQFNAWRGRCLNFFTRGEAAVTETLLAMGEVQGRGEGVAMPHLVGQRCAALASAIGVGGPFAAEGSNATLALERFRAHDQLRTMLCHGVSEVLLDRNGRWTVVLRNVSLRSRKAERNNLVLRFNEAEQRQVELSHDSHSLCSRLGQLRAALTAT